MSDEKIEGTCDTKAKLKHYYTAWINSLDQQICLYILAYGTFEK